jgi:hypothetical protein
MKEFFKDMGIQVGAAIALGVGLVVALLVAGRFMPSAPFF